MTDTHTGSSSAGSQSSSTGLAEGAVGTSSAAVLGIASVAPGYTLTASIGLIVAAVGLKMPAGFIGGLLPAARGKLAMGSRRAFPKRFAHVHPRLQAPVFGTVVAAVATGVFYTVVRSLSARSLLDTVSALGVLICWYYGITALACLWCFRDVLFTNLRNGLLKFLFPLPGGIMLLFVFVISVRERIGADNGSGASIAGIGLVFYLSFEILLIGFALMLLMRVRQPEFFRLPTTDADPDRRR
jgi:amino acid transporter